MEAPQVVGKAIVICRRNAAGQWIQVRRVTRRFRRVLRRCAVGLLFDAVALLLAACAQVGAPSGGALPPSTAHPYAQAIASQRAHDLLLRSRAPFAGPTPPITPGEKLTYTWTYAGTTTVWGAKPQPSSSPFSGGGTVTRVYGVDKSDGIYELRESRVDNGRKARSTTNSYFGFSTDSYGRLVQLGYLDNWTYADPTLSQTGADTDTTPATQWIFPLTNGTMWYDNAPVAWSSQEAVQGKSPYRFDASFVDNGDGAYTGQDQSTGGGGNSGELGYSEAYDLESAGTGTYSLAMPALGISGTSTVGTPVESSSDNVIPVVTTGIGVHEGTADVPDWYGYGGPPPDPLLRDFSMVDDGVPLPGACYSTSSAPFTEVDEKFSDTDPLQGLQQSIFVQSFFTSSGVLVCELHHEMLTLYNAGLIGEAATGTAWLQETVDDAYVLNGYAPLGKVSRSLSALPLFAGTSPAVRARVERARIIAELARRRARHRLRRS